MKTWEAMSRLIAARDGIENHEQCADEAKSSLREVGMTNAELESDFPDYIVEQGIHMLHRDPAQFRRQCQIAMLEMFARN